MASAATLQLLEDEATNQVNDVQRRLVKLKKKKPRAGTENYEQLTVAWRDQKALLTTQLLAATKQLQETIALKQAQDGNSHKRRRQKLDPRSIPSFERLDRAAATKGAVSTFLDRFKTIMVLHNIAEDEWAQYLHLAFPSCELSDVEWLKAHTAGEASWEHNALLFIEHFATDKTYASALRELRACSQGSRSVADYCMHFKQLAKATVPHNSYDVEGLPWYNQQFEEGLRAPIREGMQARDEYDDAALESLTKMADMARSAENKLLAQRSKTKNKQPPTHPKVKNHGAADQYTYEECTRCGKRHSGAAAECWARWHKDGTPLAPTKTPHDKLKVKKVRPHGQGRHRGPFDRQQLPDPAANRRPSSRGPRCPSRPRGASTDDEE
mgnify:FL=1